MKKISVIIPVYNVASYLEKCLVSVCSQSYKCLEIIVIDDGSTDGSGLIADEFMEKDERIKVFHKKNGGLSSARNVGLDNAHGDYVFFLDSDDYICENACKVLLDYAIKTKSQIIECGMIRVTGDKQEIDLHREYKELSGKQATKAFLLGEFGIQAVAWDCLYSIDIFAQLRFEEGRLHEDGWFKYQALYSARKVCLIPENLYYYVQNREGSIMTVPIKKKNIRDVIDAFDYRWHYFEARNEHELAALAKASFFSILLSYYYIAKVKIKDRNDSKLLSDEILGRLCKEKNYILHNEYLKKRRFKFNMFFYARPLTLVFNKIRFCFFK